MHEFFLTARSLYLLVLGERDDMAERDAAPKGERPTPRKAARQMGIVEMESLGPIYSAAEKREMLKAKDYPQEKWPFVLRLMSLFQLGFPLDEWGHKQLVPALLPVEEPLSRVTIFSPVFERDYLAVGCELRVQATGASHRLTNQTCCSANVVRPQGRKVGANRRVPRKRRCCQSPCSRNRPRHTLLN